MTEDRRNALARIASDVLGLIPHAIPLGAAVGPFGLEPRLRELVVLTVIEGRGCPSCESVHRYIGSLAGLTDQEVRGDRSGLTAAERSALMLARGTVSRPTDDEADPVEQHFTWDQIRQIQAVALAADTVCTVRRTAGELISKRRG
jgi:AhpD family alkylhydroperoxidase